MLLSQEPLLIQTRARNQIDNEPGLKMKPEEVEQQRRLQHGQHPADDKLLVVRKAPTGVYNCHALTFLSRRSWIGDAKAEEAVKRVLRDDEYFEIEARRALPGDVILYYYPDGALEHSGIVVDNPRDEIFPEPWILSKWAQGGEFIHRYNYCPYHWQNVRYMREGQHD